jgi:hypothetical protein
MFLIHVLLQDNTGYFMQKYIQSAVGWSATHETAWRQFGCGMLYSETRVYSGYRVRQAEMMMMMMYMNTTYGPCYYLLSRQKDQLRILTYHNAVSSSCRPSNYHPWYSDISAPLKTYPHLFYQGYGTLKSRNKALVDSSIISNFYRSLIIVIIHTSVL